MIRDRSISRRLSRSLILTMIVIWVAMVIYVLFQAHHELAETFDYILLENAIRTLPLAAEIAQGSPLPQITVDIPEIGEFDDLAEALDFAVLGPGGQVMYHETAVQLPQRFDPGFSDTGGARTYALMDPAGQFGVAVLETAGLRSYAIYQILPSMIVPLIVAVPLLGAIAYVLSRNALVPITRFAREIGARDGRNLSPIDTADTPAELDPVAAEVERLLARVSAALEAERSFSAECAHELRTPLAGALAQVQGARAAQPEQDATLEPIETSLRSLADLAETLLQHSRLENGFALSDTPVDVVEIIEYVLKEPFFATLQNDRFDVDYPAQLRLTVRMDADACAIAIRNLLGNALRYSPSSSMIRIEISATRIEVINTSPRIPPELLQHLGERFTRGVTDQSGTGLGLAITRAIMEDIGGALELRSPAPGRADGFSATLVFPKEES